MYLKSIELQGFKSFANKTVLKFNKGITGIVGPNGSGKSNVADAVRWVLGEQSAKQLRGSKMEDVIFSGTENRKPLGFAYVALTIDNSDHKLPMDYDELTVARRVYRSGESEYLINGHVSRLKDVQELFFDTGIGKEGYSIIGQGQIDKILSGKPEERRELFDEAVGIVKYKKRKALAEKNLAIEKQNLYRVGDILGELEKQVGPLSRQAEKAKEFLRLRDTLKDYDVYMYVSEYERLKETVKSLTEKVTIAAQDYQSSEKALETARHDHEAVEKQLDEMNIEVDELKHRISEIHLNREKTENEIRLLEEQIRSDMTTKQHFEERQGQVYDQISSRRSEIKEWSMELEMLSGKLVELEGKRADAESHLNLMASSIEKLRQAIDDKNSDMIEALNQMGALKARFQRYDTMLEQIQIRKAELNQRLVTMQSESDGREQKIASYEEENGNLTAKQTLLQNQIAEIQENGQIIQKQIDECHEILDKKNQEYHRFASRFQTLQGITERYEGYGNSIRKIMEQKRRIPGIIGVVADIIKVNKAYETAIETALGGSIQNVVTRDEKTAKTMIHFLKENKAGRATFLPLTSIVPRTLPEKDKLLKEEGVVGIANDLVQPTKEFSVLAEYLLGRVVVASSMDHALKLAKKYHYSLRIVTLEGESLSPGGSISGGTFKNSSNLLGRHREMDEMRLQMEILRSELEKINKETDQMHDRKRENKRKMTLIQEELQNVGLQLNTLHVRMRELKSSESSQSIVYRELSSEYEELKRQTQEIEIFRNELNVEQSQIETNKMESEAIIEELNKKLEEEVCRQQEFSGKTTELGINFTGYVQRQTFLKEHLERANTEIENLLLEQNQLEQQRAESDQSIKFKNTKVDQLLKLLDGPEYNDESLEKNLGNLQIQKEKMYLKQKRFFDLHEELSNRCSLLDKEIFRLNHAIEKSEQERSNLSTYMWDEYELTYHSALLLRNPEIISGGMEEVHKKISELKKSIKNLGHINLSAIEEYKEVSERYMTLKEQHDDLVAAEEKLLGIILDLDQAMREQFKTNFVIIQQNFNRVFSELFGGGKGTLELMDDADVLDAGIRIIAQPPGKKLQNMMQLSGGEKALTAIALLFAIQNLKPSPFCLLDEIEAALDDANVKRYARYLNNLTEDTQFIIITHRRGTMNAADVLYGVTMQEKGVSALVSVNLIENELTK